MDPYAIFLTKHWKLILYWAGIGACIAFAISFIRPLEYSSTVRLLVLQKGVTSADAYTTLKSVESLSENLSQLIHTSQFFDRVVENNPSIDKRLFGSTDRKKRKKWKRMISSSVSRGTGFLTVTVYHPEKREATKIARAVSSVLISEGWQYVSSAIEVKLVDTPLESRFPVRPALAHNTLSGFLLGGLLSFGYILHRQRKLHTKLLHR